MTEQRYGCLRCDSSYATFWQAYLAVRQCGKDDCKMGPIVPTPNGSHDPEALPPGAGEKQLAADPSRGGQRDPLLAEREKTHGSFVKNAEISQEIKFLFMRHTNNMASMQAEQKEALDMIALKLSRILSGQANYAGHWDDISGYAKLASEACRG